MKKFLLSLTALLSVGLMANAQSEIASIEFTKASDLYNDISAYSSTWKTIDGKWEFKHFNNNKRGWDFIAAGWKTDTSNPHIATCVAYAEPISKIVISVGDRLNSSAIESPTLYMADDADFTVNSTSIALTAPTDKNADWVITIDTPKANQYYKIGFNCAKQSANGQVLSVTKVALMANSTKANPEYAFTASAATAIFGEAFEAPVFSKADGAPEAIFSSSDTNVATIDATGKVSIVATGTTIISAETEGNDQYLPARASYTLNVIEVKPFAKVSEIKSGEKYLIVASGKVAKPVTGDYGYLYVTDAIIDGDNVKAEEANAFTFTAVEGGYTIQQSDGKYLFMKGTFNSFNVSAEMPETGAVWTVTFGNDGVTITNTEMNKYIQYSTGYTSFGSYADAQQGGVLPVLYGPKPADGISSIVVEDENAPIEYFNLQGVRVSEPANGLYIRRQGNTVTKVIVK